VEGYKYKIVLPEEKINESEAKKGEIKLRRKE